MKEKESLRINTDEVPDWIRVTLAQSVFEAAQRDFQNPEFMEGYLHWKAEREAADKTNAQKKGR